MFKKIRNLSLICRALIKDAYDKIKDKKAVIYGVRAYGWSVHLLLIIAFLFFNEKYVQYEKIISNYLYNDAGIFLFIFITMLETFTLLVAPIFGTKLKGKWTTYQRITWAFILFHSILHFGKFLYMEMF